MKALRPVRSRRESPNRAAPITGDGGLAGFVVGLAGAGGIARFAGAILFAKNRGENKELET